MIFRKINMEKCKICNLDFKGMKGISVHIRRFHNISSTKNYYDSFIRKGDEGICFVCGSNCNFMGLTKGYSKRCSYSCLNKGKKNPRAGTKGIIKLSQKTRLKMSEIHKQIPHPNLTFKGRTFSKETLKLKSQSSLKLWQNQDYRNKVVKNMMRGCKAKPNKKELELSGILNTNFPGEWEFVGDGKLIINGKCPDFTNINGKKAFIELYGNYWHRGQNPEDRISSFKMFGFDTLIIWESELNNSELLLKRIKDFSSSL